MQLECALVPYEPVDAGFLRPPLVTRRSSRRFTRQRGVQILLGASSVGGLIHQGRADPITAGGSRCGSHLNSAWIPMDSERPHNEKHDSDAPLTRDDSDWFARELGDGWEPVEPGIYRFVGEESAAR